MDKACVEVLRHSRIKVAENGKQAVVLNSKKEKFERLKIDGCLVKNKTASDWAISKHGVGNVVIELKGSDVAHAVKQIKETLDFLRCSEYMGAKCGALVVCSKYPKIDTKIQRAKQLIAETHKAPLHIVTKNEEYEFDALLSFSGPFRV